MTEDKILELLMGIQITITELRQKVDAIDIKLDKLADTQVADIYTLTKMTHDKTTRLDSKLGILNNRLFEQEADIQSLKLVK